ncbi:MAG: lipoyl(octanoyl) transferase LipB [Rickettsiales bacterium]|nr:lipoyl(octanoyl) transferase LipB [Rickettsiales bacterium]
MLQWTHFNRPADYVETSAQMESRVDQIIAGNAPEAVWLLEHPPLYTAGTSAKDSDLLAEQFPIYRTGRGGQWTYHGPGQRIAYVMLDLKQRQMMDVRHYVQQLEHWLIASLKQFGLTGHIREGRVGVWIELGGGKEAKIAAIGIRMRKWVTFHGISLNVQPELSHYSGITPCGIQEHGVTSLHALGISVSLADVDQALKQEFERIFGVH